MQEYERAVLEKYDIDVIGTRKTRGAILCDTSQGLLLLKEVKGAKKRIPVLCELYDFLQEQGYERVDRIVKTSDDQCAVSMEDGSTYILKRWFQGKECDVRKPAELLAAAGNLAKLHGIIRNPPRPLTVQAEQDEEPAALPVQPQMRCDPSAARPGQGLEWEYRRHNRELCKVRKFVRSLSPKGDFEYAFLRCFDQMYQWGQAALEALEASEYPELEKESRRLGTLVHGEYNYHNILMIQGDYNYRKEPYRIATTNFEKFKQDIQAEDLYYFLRKVMEKHGWKVRLGDNMLNAYSAIRPLSDAELEYLCIRFVYPEKFWKTTDSYYRSNKAWKSQKNTEKLDTAIRQTEEKKRFLEEIFSFHL